MTNNYVSFLTFFLVITVLSFVVFGFNSLSHKIDNLDYSFAEQRSEFKDIALTYRTLLQKYAESNDPYPLRWGLIQDHGKKKDKE